MGWFELKSRASFLRSRRTFLSWRRGSSSERGGRWTATVSPPAPSFSVSTAAAAMVAVVGAAASLQTAGQQRRLWVLGELGLVTTTNKPVGLIRLVLPKWRSPWAFRANWQPATRRWNWASGSFAPNQRQLALLHFLGRRVRRGNFATLLSWGVPASGSGGRNPRGDGAWLVEVQYVPDQNYCHDEILALVWFKSKINWQAKLFDQIVSVPVPTFWRFYPDSLSPSWALFFPSLVCYPTHSISATASPPYWQLI